MSKEQNIWWVVRTRFQTCPTVTPLAVLIEKPKTLIVERCGASDWRTRVPKSEKHIFRTRAEAIICAAEITASKIQYLEQEIAQLKNHLIVFEHLIEPI